MLGLKRGKVELLPHDKEWKREAQRIIATLYEVLKTAAVKIEHVGSTAIQYIHAKPIIDVAVGCTNLNSIRERNGELENNDIIFRGSDVDGQLLYVCGDFDADTRYAHIHVVDYGGTAWNNYIDFRDYLNAFPQKAHEYDELKMRLAIKYKDDRKAYTDGKAEFIDRILIEARSARKQGLI